MKKIVIVGGGTAGWMAAIAIASRFPEKHVTVVDPHTVAPIGVGESVTGVVIAFVNDPLHQLNRHEFFRRCDVTFKAGIWYRDWQGTGTEYLAPIDSPPEYFQHHYDCNAEEFYAMVAADGARLGEVQLYAQLMRANRTDHFRNSNGTINWQQAGVSCHFDALKFAAWLKESALQRKNIEYVDDVLESFQQDATTGNILHIRTRGDREIDGDLFLDCSGLHRTLLAKAYQPAWRSYADFIKVDSAIPCFQPYEANQEIPTYTEAKAMPHGWMWQIPTQSRFGRGYIFSSRYIDDQQAIAEMRSQGVDPGDAPRVLRFSPGRFEKLWCGNVCSIGLSGGFIEPLEASTIHGMYVQIRLLTEVLLPFLTPESLPRCAEQYHQLISAAYDDYLDFISYHYHTGRTDTEFWRDYQSPAAMTATNQARWDKWRYAFPMREDFTPIYTQRAGHTTGLVIWATMLDGLQQLSREQAQRVVSMSRQPQKMRDNAARYVQVRNFVVANSLTHREAIQFFCDG
jgi:tryptophan 6-halogenase